MKNLRSELSKREDLVKDFDDRISMEADRLKNLVNELKLTVPTSMTGVSNTMQTNLNSAMSRARCNRENQLSLSPHRHQDPDRPRGDGHTLYSQTGETNLTQTNGH